MILHIIGMIGVDGALYKSMEFVGEGVSNLSMDDRFTIANMAIEAGGKNGIFPVDEKAIAYMKEHSKREYKIFEADEDAVYDEEYTIDLSTLRPTIAFPHLPENTKTIDEITEPVTIDQAVIGSCTNGRIDDLRVAASILKGRKVKKGIRCIVIPATQADLPAGNGGGTAENLYRGRRCCEHTDLRTMSWRIYGYSGRQGALHFHDKPKFCRSYGTRWIRGISGKPGSCGSICSDRRDLCAGGAGALTKCAIRKRILHL